MKKMENQGFIVNTKGSSALSRSDQDELILKNTSNLSNIKVRFRDMSNEEFKQWFVGFTDAEGCFRIGINKKNKVISFNCTIGLHIDDREVLEFIKNKLNCGNVYTSENVATFVVTKLSDIRNILIPIYEEFPLNGSKHLDYLAFKEAINIKLDSLKSDKLDLITRIKSNMNSTRVESEFPSSHTIRITPYWLLGFIEGDGSFFVNAQMRIILSITATATQAPLMNAIKLFLDSYSVEDAHLKTSPQYIEILSQRTHLYVRGKTAANGNSSITLHLGQVNYIVDKFIPLLSNLSFVSKKYKDFRDWSFIAYLIYTGKHNTKAGKELILKICKGMNNYRLSTFKSLNNQPVLPSLIKEVLKTEDIYVKNHEGLRINFTTRTLVKGQLFYILAEGSSGKILIFKDSKTCGDYFGLNYQAINVKLNKGVSIKSSNNIEFKLYRKPL